MVKDIYEGENLIAQVYNLKNFSGFGFPTKEESSLQFGYRHVTEELSIPGHIHKRVVRELDNTSEFLFVLEGKMTLEIYSENEEILDQVVLTKNMALLQFYGGHKIDLDPATKFFEIKQGPYFDKGSDKYEL